MNALFYLYLSTRILVIIYIYTNLKFKTM